MLVFKNCCSFFLSFRYRTLVLLFHQRLSEFQCGIYFSAACAATDLSHGVSASEISWWVPVRQLWEPSTGSLDLSRVTKGRACLPKSSFPLLEVKLGSGRVFGVIAKFLELITQFATDPTVELLCRRNTQWGASACVLSAKGQNHVFFHCYFFIPLPGHFL